MLLFISALLLFAVAVAILDADRIGLKPISARILNIHIVTNTIKQHVPESLTPEDQVR